MDWWFVGINAENNLFKILRLVERVEGVFLYLISKYILLEWGADTIFYVDKVVGWLKNLLTEYCNWVGFAVVLFIPWWVWFQFLILVEQNETLVKDPSSHITNSSLFYVKIIFCIDWSILKLIWVCLISRFTASIRYISKIWSNPSAS